MVKQFLSQKKGFILVSHDRDLLDAVIDHVLVLNRKTIEVQAGNFSSWWANKERSDTFALAENEKHLKEIHKLKAAADRSKRKTLGCIRSAHFLCQSGYLLFIRNAPKLL